MHEHIICIYLINVCPTYTGEISENCHNSGHCRNDLQGKETIFTPYLVIWAAQRINLRQIQLPLVLTVTDKILVGQRKERGEYGYIGIDIFHELPLPTNSSDLPYKVPQNTYILLKYIFLPVSNVLSIF